jgi:TolB-like protein/Flp pilus assembly protein TadD
MGLIDELKRRNVIRVAVLYLVAGWLVIQISDVVFPALGVPDFGLRFIIGFLIVCFPLALIFSWVYEMTPEGLKKEREIDRTQSITPATGHKINALIIGLLVLAIVAVVADRLIPEPPAESGARAQQDAARGGEIVRDPAAEPSQGVNETIGNTAPEKSVAVLPFVNMSNDPDNEFFSDGLSEELLNVLAGIPGLYVAARTSSFYFKGHTGDIGEIALQLRVRNVLEGSVRKSGDKVRITAQLIDATNGYHLWSDTYDRNIEDVFAVQDEISQHVAEALQVALLSGDEPAREADKPTENMDAYLAYLRGQQHVNAGGVEGFVSAVADFEEAIELDPGFAEAHASLGLAWASQISWGNITYADAGDKVRSAADRALALNDQLALAWAADGLAYAYSGPARQRDPRVLQSIERARDLDPDNTDILYWYTQALGWVDRASDSIEPLKKGLLRDPLSSVLHNRLADVQLQDREFDAARQSFLTAAQLGPMNPRPPDGLAGLERNQGNFDEAIRWQAKVIDLDPADGFSRSLLTVDYLELGDADRARQWADAAMAISPESPMSRATLALAQWFQGDREQAMVGINRFYENFTLGSTGDPGYWMLVMSLNHWLSVGDLEKAGSVASHYVVGDRPLATAPAPGDKPNGLRTFEQVEILSLIRARDGDEKANRMADDWLRWLDAGVQGWNDGLIASTRCNLLASKGDLANAMEACRASLRASENSTFVLLRLSPMLDPLRDTPEWRTWLDEISKDRAQHLAKLRASGDEPTPH